jgi:hypothetical protein
MKDTLQKYKNNELSASDTEGLENKMLGAIVAREQRQKWDNLLKNEGHERDVIENPVSQQIPVGTARTFKLSRYAIGLAASLLLVAAMVWQIMGSQSVVDIADGYISSERFASPSVRMGNAADEKNWADAKNAYRDGNYEAAAQSIDAIPMPSVEQQFYWSLSQMYKKNPDYEKAALGFKTTHDKYQNFKDEAKWFYALCLIKLKKNDEAKKVLEEIKNDSAWKAEEAKNLLNKL